MSPVQGKTSNSVFDAAECKTLRFLITPHHKSHNGEGGSTDTINDGGVYWNTPETRAATHFSEADRKKSKMSPKLLAVPELARRSWNHVAIPAEVKYKLNNAVSCFPRASKGKSKGKSSGATAGPSNFNTSRDGHGTSAPMSPIMPTSNLLW